MKELLMGNAAIGLGAIRAGVGVVTGYPGTPSTEVLETIAKARPNDVYVEWSVNEKVALEVAAGAAYTGTRALVTMKQVGLNVASDPLMSLAYIGIKGGMVVLVADDPGPISSQTEQDTRTFAQYAKLPVFDPATPEEAYEMIGEAFDYSEKYGTPVLFRPTTRVCHACAVIDTDGERKEIHAEGFTKDPRWVIFPRLSTAAHAKIEKRNPEIAEEFSTYPRNTVENWGADGKTAKRVIVTGGVNAMYVKEALLALGSPDTRVLKIATPFPFPETLATNFLADAEEVLCVEELDPVLERALLQLCGKRHLHVTVRGKLTGDVQAAGENTNESVKAVVAKYLGIETEAPEVLPEMPALPARPPVLCAGCPHRASFYAVKVAMQGKKCLFAGDIGCYTLGNAMPLDMTETCLCMGAGLTIGQGVHRGEPDRHAFAFIGDSTFFHTGIPGVINAVYNGTDLTVVVLDNSTTAMTGHQPHPGTGMTMMGDVAEKVSIPKILEAVGVSDIQIVDPLDLPAAIEAAKHAYDVKGVSAIIYKSPCIAVTKPRGTMTITENCISCKKCIKALGCPAIYRESGEVKIDATLCTGCGLCAAVCPVHAIEKGGANT